MSEVEQKKARTLSEVEQEYAGLCQRLGHLTYQIDAFKKDSDQLSATLRDLNLEAFDIKNKEKAAAQAVLAAAAEGPGAEVAGA